jgi:hypothetical protein
MKRQAYGFRDQEFFKLKILGIHETKQALVGWARRKPIHRERAGAFTADRERQASRLRVATFTPP